MPRIAHVDPIAAPADELSWRRRSYRSPSARWTLLLRDPREWHMGADGWRAELWSGARNVSRSHRAVLELANDTGFRACDDLRPWAADDRTLALMTWTVTKPIVLYDVERRHTHEPPARHELPHSAQWAPDLDRLLLPFSSGGELYDATGTHRGRADWLADDEYTLYTDWTQWGMFFLIARQSPDSRTRLVFYDGVRGQRVDAMDLDPVDLVPYDHERYSTLPRRALTLVLSSGVRAAGVLLDTWHAARFDPRTSTLRLATYRPVSVPDRDRLTCEVEAQWVAVTLTA